MPKNIVPARLDEELYSMLTEIMEKAKLNSQSEAIRYCVKYTWKGVFTSASDSSVCKERLEQIYQAILYTLLECIKTNNGKKLDNFDKPSILSYFELVRGKFEEES